MERIEKLKVAIKDRFRLTALSVLFLGITTFVSVLFVYLTGPENYTAFDLISVIIGSVMGQVTLLMSMNIIAVLFKKEAPEEKTPLKKIELKDLEDIEN
ncbi:hypothetical protein ES702_02154 [subsurface metagenome]